MKIITAYPVIKNGKEISDKFLSNTMNYSSANGATNFKDLLKKGNELIGSGKVTNVIQSLRSLKGQTTKKPMAKPLPPPPPPPPKGLSMGAKIGIGVGAAAVLGLIIYFVVKSKKK